MTTLMASFRILHLSDLHERVALPFMSDSRKRLIEVQNVRRHRVLGAEFRRVLTEIVSERRPDVIVFTGDLADWGLDEEYQRAEARLNEILSLVGISVDRLFLVPGNHDIKRTECVDHWKEVRGLVGENLQSVSEWLVGLRAPRGVSPNALDMIPERQGAFRRFLDRMRLSHQRPENGRHGQLGYRSELRLSDRHVIHMIGLDTAWLAGDDADAGRLALTDHQIDMHTTDDEGHDLSGFRLALMHHPLHYLADHADAARLLADRVDLVLYGHQHHAAALDASDPDRHLQTLAAGSVFEGDQGDRWVNGFNVIDVELDDDSRPIHYDVGFWAWSANGHWHPHSALYKNAPNGRLKWKPRPDKTRSRKATKEPEADPGAAAPDPELVQSFKHSIGTLFGAGPLSQWARVPKLNLDSTLPPAVLSILEPQDREIGKRLVAYVRDTLTSGLVQDISSGALLMTPADKKVIRRNLIECMDAAVKLCMDPKKRAALRALSGQLSVPANHMDGATLALREQPFAALATVPNSPNLVTRSRYACAFELEQGVGPDEYLGLASLIASMPSDRNLEGAAMQIRNKAELDDWRGYLLDEQDNGRGRMLVLGRDRSNVLSDQTVSWLRDFGVTVVVLTGDSDGTFWWLDEVRLLGKVRGFIADLERIQ